MELAFEKWIIKLNINIFRLYFETDTIFGNGHIGPFLEKLWKWHFFGNGQVELFETAPNQ